MGDGVTATTDRPPAPPAVPLSLGRAPTWERAHQGDPRAIALMDRHYSREPHRRGASHFMPPGPALVLLTPDGLALWGTSAPRFVSAQSWAGRNGWPLAWVCTVFRNEGPARSSDLIRAAVAATQHVHGEPPPGGFLTFVDAAKVRHKRDAGRCFLRAGWTRIGTTAAGLVVLHQSPAAMPEPSPPLRTTEQLRLWEMSA
jgi:hypothetical protein